jgi:hypothetical protein
VVAFVKQPSYCGMRNARFLIRQSACKEDQIMATRSQKKRQSTAAKLRTGGASSKGRKPAAMQGHKLALPRKVETNPNSVDVVGRIPKDIHVDPEITEGHRGYDETGPSEIIQPEG